MSAQDLLSVLDCSESDHGESLSEKEKASSSTPSSLPHTPSKPWYSLHGKVACIPAESSSWSHMPTPLVPSHLLDHVGKQVSSLHLGISSNQGESPQWLSLRNSGYISGFPSGLDKADNTQENINTDLETHKHNCVYLCLTLTAEGKRPPSFLQFSHK